MSQDPMYEIDYERRANQPVSEGLHTFRITSITEGESSNKNPMWTVRLTCEDEGPEKGKEATLWLVLTDSSRWKVEKFLDAVGAPSTGSGTYQKFLNRRIRAQISHSNRDGRTQADVGEMFPASQTPANPAAAKVTKAATAPVARTGAASGGPGTNNNAAAVAAGLKKTAKVASKGLPTDVVSSEDEIPFD